MGHREYHFLKNLQNHVNILRVYSHSSNGILAEKATASSDVLGKSTSVQSSNAYNVLEKGFDYMTMEYCHDGDLFDFIKRSGKIKEGLAKYLFLQILDGIEFLHSKAEVAHLDIKLENILIGNNYKLKICDFGFFENIT